ncbi:MAG: crosslink repair DNA glycosylase YcaQ family protein, partial [Myxococcota bacterium]
VWAHHQDLLAPEPTALAQVLSRTGWVRTLGGVEAYLAMRARCPNLTAADVHEAVQTGDLCVTPSVRGCIYLVPKADLPLALAISDALSSKRRQADLRKVHVSADELAHVCDAITEALASGPLTTAGLRKALPDGVVRSLGDAGKKIGLSSTLPPALRELEATGRIRRRPQNHQLDHERYEWVAHTGTEDHAPLPQVAQALAQRFFQWSGASTLDAFVAWSGLGKRVAKTAVDTLDLQPVQIEGVGERLTACTRVPDATGRAIGIPGMDNLHHLPQSAAPFVSAAYHGLTVGAFGARRVGQLGTVKHLFERMIVVDGRFVGAWGYDPDHHTVEAHVWEPDFAEPAQAEAASLTAFLKPLGGGKVFSIDKDENLRTRLARVRSYA